MNYIWFKSLLAAAEQIGTIEKAELSKYGSCWINIKGLTSEGKGFTVYMRLEEPKDGDE